MLLFETVGRRPTATGGILIAFLWVSKENTVVSLPSAKLGQIYRYLIKDSHSEISAPKFHSYHEFDVIASEILSMYERFKKEFLSNLV